MGNNLNGRQRATCALLAGILVFIVGHSRTWADESPDPCTEVSPITVGNLAPCSGLLWPVPWSRRALTCIEVDLPAVRAELTLQIKQLQAQLDANTHTLDACRGALDACEASVEEVIAPINPWWRSPILWTVVGAVVGAGVVGLSWWVVER